MTRTITLKLFTLTLLAGLSITPAQAENFAYFHLDALGSPVAATDELGNLLWREDYTPYGDRILNDPAAANDSRWYTGHVHDQDTGLTYMGARYYDPTLGRFMGVDPAAFQESAVHSFNRYSYGNNNPYRYVDPDGNIPLDTIVDAGFVIYDFGQFLGAGAAFAVGVITGDSALQGIAQQGLIDTGANLGGSLTGLAIPFAPAAITRGVAKGVGGVAKGGDKTIFRMGTSKESPTRLNRKAQEAERKTGTHGVSGSTTRPDVPCSSASCSSLEAAGFKVKPTPSRRDPNHVTIELPKPVTKEAAKRFNDAFGR